MTGIPRKLLLAAGVLAALLPGSPAFAFDVVDREVSHVDTRYVSVGVGLGMTGFAFQEGVSGENGFGFKVTVAHPFNRYLQAEIFYQFSTFRWTTPDPLFTGESLDTRAALNQQGIRLLAIWPEYVVQPYVAVGLGGYAFTGVNRDTALSFPADFELPFAAGFRSYVYKNRLSFDVEFNYHLLFGENQDADTLSLLGLDRVAFDTYSVLATFTYFLF